MLTRDLMTPNPITVEATATLGDALGLMKKHKIRELPVVEDGAIVGILTDRDLKMALGPDSRHLDLRAIERSQLEGQVDWFMSNHVVSVRDDSPLEDTGELILERRIGALPVVDADGELVGIIAASDFVRLALRQLEG